MQLSCGLTAQFTNSKPAPTEMKKYPAFSMSEGSPLQEVIIHHQLVQLKSITLFSSYKRKMETKDTSIIQGL